VEDEIYQDREGESFYRCPESVGDIWRCIYTFDTDDPGCHYLYEVLKSYSKDASVVFLGFNVPGKSEAREFQERYEERISDLPTTLLVCSSGKADLFA